jgi:hypothetical protein
LANSFFSCHQAYRRNSQGDANCSELAREAAIVSRFCDSNLGRRSGGLYETNSDLCYKATSFNGFVISMRYEGDSDWRKSVRESVQGIRDGAFERFSSLPIVGRLLNLLPDCNYNYEDNIATVPEGVRLPHGMRQRDVPGITADCEF